MSERMNTTYIVLCQNATDGDTALYGALDFAVEARNPTAAARIARERWGYRDAIAVVPAVFFSEFQRLVVPA